ncbi:hypothetical protein [Nostoc commune]|uniref:hypothetical protein n=1 Tax=Nostoc commune TaxID=1178 RepID=UPI0015E7FDF3|nr:hypothetical protein [Nostoc commune]
MKATRERCLRQATPTQKLATLWQEIIAEARAALPERPMKSAFLPLENLKGKMSKN